VTPLLSPDAAAELLGVSKKLVYRLAREGSLPSLAIHTALRFDPADVEAFARSCRREGPTGPLRKGGRRTEITTPRSRRGDGIG
jgi:excisionase family DNA binding protein